MLDQDPLSLDLLDLLLDPDSIALLELFSGGRLSTRCKILSYIKCNLLKIVYLMSIGDWARPVEHTPVHPSSDCLYRYNII